MPQRQLVGQPKALTGLGAEMSRNGDHHPPPNPPPILLESRTHTEGSCSLRTLLHFCTACLLVPLAMSASHGPCSGPCGGMGTQPTGNAALLTWMDLDPGSTGVPGCQPPGPGCFPAWWGLGSGRGWAPGTVPQWRQLVPEAWRWWLLCCPTAIHQWFVVLGCTLTGGARHRAPTAPAQRDPGGRGAPHTPTHRKAWEHLCDGVFSSHGAGLERKPRAALSTQGP